MSRHSKNNTAGAVFTYHERKKLKDQGTKTMLLAAENMHQFEECWLCLSPAENPVTTPNGYIYCWDCLIANLGEQKEKNDKNYIAWQLAMQNQEMKKAKEEVDEAQKQAEKFVQTNFSLTKNSQADTLSNKKRSQSFWIAENAPSHKPQPVQSKPPSRLLHCPTSKQPIKLKDLVKLKPKRDPKNPFNSSKWLCEITGKEIISQEAIAIKKTGHVILKSCLAENLVQGFIPGENLTESDYIDLIQGATSFTAHNNIVSKMSRPKME